MIFDDQFHLLFLLMWFTGAGAFIGFLLGMGANEQR